jgi:hypothetical protein
LGPEIGESVPVEVPTGGGGGMGGSVVMHTEYIDRPLPIVRIRTIEDKEDIENKEIWVLDIKDYDSI